MSDEIHIHYEFQSIKFEVATGKNQGLAVAEGSITVSGKKGHFELKLSPKEDGEWLLRSIKFNKIANVFQSQYLYQDMLNRAAVLLKTINFWTVVSDNSNGAQIACNQQLAPREFADQVFSSFRPDMLSLPMVNWDAIWPLVESRVKSDQYFQVRGFSVDEVVRAIPPSRKFSTGNGCVLNIRRPPIQTLSQAWQLIFLKKVNSGFQPTILPEPH